MKKIITLFAATLLAVGANAQTEETLQVKFDNSGCIQVVSENVQLNLKAQYQAFQIVNSDNAFSPDGYKGLKVHYKLDETNTSKINVHVNVGKKSDGTGNDWDGMYQELQQGQEEISVVFSSEVLALEKIKSITIQQADNGFANVLIKKIYLIKNDGSEEQLSPFASAGDGLAASVWESAVLKFRSMYANVQIVDKNGNSLTYDPTRNTKQIYTIEFAETPTLALKLLPNKNEKDQWGGYIPISYNFNVDNSTVANSTQVFTFDNTNINESMIELRLSNFTDGSGTVTVNSVKRGVIYPTSSAVANDGSSSYWGTYSNNLAAVELSGDGVEVYNVTLGADENKLVFTRRAENKVAKGEGVIVKSKSSSFNVAVISDVPAATATENLLKATPTTAQKIEGGDKTLYYLAFESNDSKKNLGFYWNAEKGTSLNAVPGKAYLAIPSAKPMSLRRSIVIDDSETTVIESVKAERGQQEAIYNIAGQRVNKLSKGVNIVGNNKIIIR